jgi:acyl-CoA reductase-like NAD-dependent aldehyde dehydrogenase
MSSGQWRGGRDRGRSRPGQTPPGGLAQVPVAERAAILGRSVDAFVARRDEIAREFTWQMGRPVRYTPNEVNGFEERSRYMIEVAEQALTDVQVGQKPSFTRLFAKCCSASRSSLRPGTIRT